MNEFKVGIKALEKAK